MATNTQLLSKGARGPEVSQIQQALKDYGFYTGNIDGIYGPKTAEAVKQFQTNTGIKIDSIVGPQTRGKLDEWSQNPGMAITTDPLVKEIVKGDPIAEKTFNALSEEGGNRLDLLAAAAKLGESQLFKGFTGNAANDIANFYELAYNNLSPAFKESLDFSRKDLEFALDNEIANYKDNIASTQDQIFNDKLDLDYSQAQSNNIDSSLGKTQRTMFQDSSNRTLDSLGRNTNYKLSSLARQFERDYGTDEADSLNRRISQPGSVSSIGKYMPTSNKKDAFSLAGDQTGKLKQQFNAQVESLGNSKLKNTVNYPVQ